jgi:hypothetical protein
MRETLKESGRLLQFPGASENKILILKENPNGSEKPVEILLGFQEAFERLIR